MSLRAEDLVAAGLAAPERLDEMRRVADRFAVALTGDVAALIDRAAHHLAGGSGSRQPARPHQRYRRSQFGGWSRGSSAKASCSRIV